MKYIIEFKTLQENCAHFDDTRVVAIRCRHADFEGDTCEEGECPIIAGKWPIEDEDSIIESEETIKRYNPSQFHFLAGHMQEDTQGEWVKYEDACPIIESEETMTIPRQYSLVKVKLNLPKQYTNQYPFKDGDLMIFLGEIPNMRGHCVVMTHPTGSIFSGYHIEYFTEVDDD